MSTSSNGAVSRSRPPGLAPDLRHLAAWGGVALALALALTAAVAASDGPLSGDVRFARFVQDTVPIGGVTQSIRNMNNTESVTLAGCIGAAGLWYTGRRQQAMILVAGIVVLILVTLGLKNAIDRERPDAELIDVSVIGRSASYPSGHAISSTMLIGFLLYVVATAQVGAMLKALTAAAFAVLAVSNGLGTIHSGAHWPSDVAGGYLWAVVLVIGLIAVDRVLTRRRMGTVVTPASGAAEDEAVALTPARK